VIWGRILKKTLQKIYWMAKRIVKISLFFMAICLLWMCKPGKQLYFRDMAMLYVNQDHGNLKLKIFRQNDSLAQVYFETSATSSVLKDTLSLVYGVYPGFETRQMIDADTIIFLPKAKPPFSFEVQLTKSLNIGLSIYVKYAGRVDYNLIQINNLSNNASENFLVLGKDDLPLLQNYFGENTNVKLRFNQKQQETLTTYFYKRDFSIALPPFVYSKRAPFQYKPDSVFELNLKDAQSGPILISERGFYHFLADTNQKEGLSIFRFYDGFPQVTDAEQMLYPLRYITTEEEFQGLKNTENPKLAVESFWLDQKGNVERARYAIKKYYSRVERANLLFSSYMEGWKTDRGLIYIVYGDPHKVNKGDGYEVWAYGDPNSTNKREFTFVQVINPFTDNDFQLIKSPAFKTSWYYAVDNWRR
jgi:GWxTD domain-containing protein